jgi:hypothetical protein
MMMKRFSSQTLIKLTACAVLAVGFTSIAAASCGDSLAAMASGKAIVSSSMAKQLQARNAKPSSGSSIVGLWYVQFISGGVTIQEAYQNWNAGGTEVHNPNTDPRTGNVCLGTWVSASGGAFTLAHRVWNWDNAGNFLGTINLNETTHVTHGSTQQTGTFTLDFYDPDGNFITSITGTVTGQRITAD